MASTYVTYDEYVAGGGVVLSAENASKFLKKASRAVDTLTFNRIRGQFDSLTDFQQAIITDVVIELADFMAENDDLLESIVSNYSINGVSMTFGESWNVKIINGVAIRTDIYNLLVQTGLCSRVVR